MATTSQTAPSVLPVTYEQYKAQMATRQTGDAELGQEAFLKLLIEQMKHQDPLNPMDNADFTQQTTNFSQLEQMIAMNKSLESLIEMQNAGETGQGGLFDSAGMIGKIVEYDTNAIFVEDDSSTAISFYASEASSKAQLRVYNEDGSLASIIDLDSVSKGSNAVMVNDGTSGITLPKGTYFFEVTGTDVNGNELTVGTYGESEVTGIRMSGDQIYYEIENGLVPRDAIYAIKEKPVSNPEDARA